MINKTSLKKYLIILLLCIFSLGLINCDDETPDDGGGGGIENPPLHIPVIEITTSQTRISIYDEEYREYDFTKLFKITEDGKEVAVDSSFIDTTKIQLEEGTYPVYCNYKGKSKLVDVVIKKVDYQISSKNKMLFLSAEEIFDYDYRQEFVITRNGVEIEVLPEYISITSTKEGKYEVVCKYKNLQETIEVFTKEVKIEVESTAEKVRLCDEDVENYDFKSLFMIKKDGEPIEVLDSYLTKNVNNVEGNYFVICSYQNVFKKVTVEVYKTIYEITSLKEMIEIKQSEINNIDYRQYFKLTRNGEELEITNEMISNNIESSIGLYELTCTYKGIQKTVYVNVTLEHQIDIIAAYKEIEIKKDQILNYGYKKLFIIYVDNNWLETTNDYLSFDKEDLTNVNSFVVTCSYELDGVRNTKSITVSVVENIEYIVYTKNIITYPNSNPIDYNDLFEIYVKDQKIAVNTEEINGNVDYSHVGIYPLTITLNGVTYTSTVEVKMGAILEYRTSEKVQIALGTDKDSYLFSQDFVLIVNGIIYKDFPQTFIDTSEVNFNELGVYKAKAKIPYNDSKLGLSSVKFTYVEKEITYEVVKSKYSIENINEVTMVTKDEDLLKAIEVTIGSRKVDLTLNRNWAGVLTCYVDITSGEIIKDGTVHKATLDVYVFGVSSDPVTVEIKYCFEKDIQITSKNIAIYSGNGYYLYELFTIQESNNNVEVDDSFLSGYVDFNNPGEYYITCTYEGVSATAQVMVLDSKIIGTYKTVQKTIPEDTKYGDDEYEDEHIPSKPIGDFIIDENGNYHFENNNITVVKALDANNVIININKYEYYMHYLDGILILEPINDHKLQYNNQNRPIVFFNANKYRINNLFSINYSKTGHIITLTTTGYSFDVFDIVDLNTNERFYFTMKITLVSRTSADTIYEIRYGICTFNDGFNIETSKDGIINFENQNYRFLVLSKTLGQIDNTYQEEKKYASQTYVYTEGDNVYKLVMNANQNFVFKEGTKTIFSITYNDALKQKNTIIDYDNDILMIYQIDDAFYGTYAYKFALNFEDKTMELVKKDDYYGYYICGDMLIFIDGYGSGIAKENKNTYYEYPFTYQKKGNELVFSFDTKGAFGKEMTFYIHDLLNVLKVKDTEDKKFSGLVFENQIITKGAIIKINKYVFGNAPAIEKEELYNAISIITKDGELTLEQKKGKIPGTDIYYIVTNKIKFGTAGFYQLIINIPFENQIIENYSCVEMLGNVYANQNIPGSYNFGLTNKNIYLSLDTYGYGLVMIDSTEYSGLYVITNDGFVLNAFDNKGNKLKIVGKNIEEDIVFVRATGASTFGDYFTKGDKEVAGNSNYTIRKFVNSGKEVFVLSKSGSQNGEVVTGRLLNSDENIYEFIDSQGNILLLKINKWNDLNTGITEADGYEGTYTKDGENSLVLDGFGNATLNEKYIGKYTINSYKEQRVALIKNENVSLECVVYSIDKILYNYNTIEISLNSSLISGSEFTSEYKFTCSDEIFNAFTSFTFVEGGKVIITSSSSDHDGNCTVDKYNPLFISENGTYTVEGNIVTVVSGGFTFTFLIENILNPSSLKTLSSTLDSNAQGYFNVGTRFVK